MEAGRGDVPGFVNGVLPADCRSRTYLNHVTSKWGVLVLLALSQGTLRWGALRHTVEGISEKMLASTLRTLESDKFVERISYPEVPPRVEYRLTPEGEELAALLLPLLGWVARHVDEHALDA